MNKCKINSLVVALLLLVPCLALALPGPHDPATGGYPFTCNSCHVSPASFGDMLANFANNVCLRCHRTGDPNTSKAFQNVDFADIDNSSSSVRVGTAYNTSHKWEGTAINTRAKAIAPIDPNTAKG